MNSSRILPKRVRTKKKKKKELNADADAASMNPKRTNAVKFFEIKVWVWFLVLSPTFAPFFFFFRHEQYIKAYKYYKKSE